MKELWKKFEICSPIIEDGSWSDKDKIKNAIENGCEVSNFHMNDEHIISRSPNNWTFEDYSTKCINFWSTFSDGQSFEYSPFKDEIRCKVEIYNCNNYSGCREELRWSATVILPKSFVTELESSINYAFEDYLQIQFNLFKAEEERLWKEALKLKLLS